MKFQDFINTVTESSRTLLDDVWLAEWRPESGMHVVMITGKLARKGLERIMNAINPEDFTYEIRVFDIAVAAWIDNPMVVDQIGDLSGVDVVLTPGKLIGDENELSKQLGVKVMRGPGCYSELPVFLEVENFEDINSDDIVRPKLIVLGKPGSGKSTFARTLAKTYEVPYLTISNMLQTAVSDQEPVGDIAKEFLTKGETIPPNIMASLANNRLLDDDASKGFVMEGYPATARDLQWMRDLKLEFDAVVYFDVSDDKAKLRLLSQRDCGDAIDNQAELFKDTQEIVDQYQDAAWFIRVDTEDRTEREIVADMLTQIETMMQQCIKPNFGDAPLSK